MYSLFHSSPRFTVHLRRAVGKLAFAAASWAVASGSALAANANYTVDVKPIPAAVSVSRDNLTTYAAYSVKITNNNSNVNNNFVFSAYTTVSNLVSGSASANFAQLLQLTPANACSDANSTTSNTFSCTVGQFPGGPSSVSFVMLFAAPSTSSGAVFGDPPNSSQIDLNFSITYSNGSQSSTQTPSSPYCTVNDAASSPGSCSGVVSTTLNTSNSVAFRTTMDTYLPSGGGLFTFFTSNGQKVDNPGVQYTGDTCNTTGCLIQSSASPKSGADYSFTATGVLRVPGDLGLTTASMIHSILSTTQGLTNDTLTTNQTQIKIPASVAFGTPVIIELRRDASTVRNGSGVNRAPVQYFFELDDLYQVNLTSILNCKDLPTGQLDADNPICILSRTAFTTKNAPKPEDVGDWRIVLKTLQNGRLSW